MQDKVFPLKFGTKIGEDVFNSGMRCQTVLHKTRSLKTGPCRADTRPASPNCHERFSAVQGYYTVQIGNSLPTFWGNISVQFSKVNKSKRENRP